MSLKKVNNAVKTDTDIVITLDTHNENYLETQEGINLPVNTVLNTIMVGN